MRIAITDLSGAEVYWSPLKRIRHPVGLSAWPPDTKLSEEYTFEAPAPGTYLLYGYCGETRTPPIRLISKADVSPPAKAGD
ncbi:MAG TPA: hypothetical protein VLA05_04465 [Coriobacteriia bacterium]|nr:hypothetical protein [Coriobacteriia bacterium]